jgi:hypothetical protein
LTALSHSRNRYDWLGEGSYFFENDLERALMFAQASRDNPKKMYTRRAIATPAAVGAVLCISRCLDMTTQTGIGIFRDAYRHMVAGFSLTGTPLPVNEPADPADRDVLLRHLDAAIFNFIHESRKADGTEPFQAVRAAFYQGDEIAPLSGFRENSHIQIAVRDNACVVGWFLPSGAKQMSNDAYAAAQRRQRQMEADRKPRRRA